MEEILHQAERLEKDYDWLGASRSYEKALDLLSEGDFSGKGDVTERLGYAFCRAAFQAENNDEFRERMRKSTAAYEKAVGFYGKLNDPKKRPRASRCDAMIHYISYWLAPEAKEKKKMIDGCWRLTKEALAAFKEAAEDWEYGKTHNQLSSSVVFAFCLEWDFQAREKLVKEAVEHGEQAIRFLSTFENASELARAYARTALYLGVFNYYFLDEDKKEKDYKKIQDYWQKAKGLSEDAALFELLHPLFGPQMIIWGEATEEAIKNLKKALQHGRKTRDRFTIGCACDWLTYHSGWRRWATEDPEKRSKLYKTALKYAETAKQQYAAISFTSPRTEAYWVEWMHIEHYALLASDEIDLKKKRGLLKKAKEAAENGLEQAESTQCPNVIGYVNHIFSQRLTGLARIETDSLQKRKLLEEALKRSKKANNIIEQLHRLVNWNLGGTLTNLASIKYQLAHLVEDSETKKNMIQEALADREKGLELALKAPLDARRMQGYFGNLSWMKYSTGAWLNLLYEFTGDNDYLRKAVRAFAEAAEFFQNTNLKSRVAMCHWKAAQTYDALSEHLNAAEGFESASESYRLVAEKIPQLSGFYSNYASYMRAWAEIERSRHERENENYSKSRDHYRACSRLLERTEKWSYLSSYYFSWSLLDRGENFSRLDRSQDAIKAFNEAGRTFRASAVSLREKVQRLEKSEEKDEAFKLSNVAGLRRQYCMGRVLMEEAKLSDRKNERILSAQKYASAAEIFREIGPNFERKEAREELQFAATICEAWEKMELAEDRGDAVLYKKAAELFAKASEISRRKTAELTAMGNSCFCEALEMGMKFMATSNRDFYAGAKLRMENAAGYYQRAGFEKPALVVEATKRLFDAYAYVGKAEAEAEPEKRVRFYLMAEKCLGLSAKSYGKAGFLGKKNEVLQNLERVRKERELAFSLNELLIAPAVLSNVTEVSMPDLTEKAAGLNDLESVNIKASVSIPKEFVESEKFEVRLDLANVGNKPGLLVRIDGLLPPRSKILKLPSYCTLEGASLNMRGKRLEPLSVESVNVWVQVSDVVSISLSPSVVYVDVLGNFRRTKAEEVKIHPIVKFEFRGAQAVFNYLVDAFIEDCAKRRLGVEKSGWRSFPQIIKGAEVPKRSLYGAGGRIGHGLSELQRKGLVDLETLLGGRGRGGHILRVRIHHMKELVKKYVKEKAPSLLT